VIVTMTDHDAATTVGHIVQMQAQDCGFRLYMAVFWWHSVAAASGGDDDDDGAL
jgi:hypothetical protein